VKYCIIIPDGGADLPLEELGGKTPLEAANLPNLRALAAAGRVGCAVTTPEGFEAGSDVCSMSLLGYDPKKYHTGRAPLEAAALGLSPGPRDWIFRLNLVTTGQPGTDAEGLMLDHSAGAITDREARALIHDLLAHWRAHAPDALRGIEVTPGVSYRNILVDSGGRDYSDLTTTPPHAIPGERWDAHLPKGRAAAMLRALIDLSSDFLPRHEINIARVEQGLRPATLAWMWGQGTRPTVPSFHSRFGVKGAMITSVDLLAGIASYIGWDRLNVPGLTSYHDTDYAAQGRATVAALASYDLVCTHVEAPDEASHQADWRTKVASLEAIDEHIVGPVARAMRDEWSAAADAHSSADAPLLARDATTKADASRSPAADEPGWRILVMPDHFTLCSTRKHDPTPVPFLMAGSWVRSAVQREFTEEAAAASDLIIDPGHDLMEYFLFSGLLRANPSR
jgi:2,3-bisphosphoglycerate-independent phosphoglycerate mutase